MYKTKENIFVFDLWGGAEKEKLKSMATWRESCRLTAIQARQTDRFPEKLFQATSKNHSKMPGVTARSAAKNMSRGARAKADKNARRVEAALTDEIPYTTYGKITKALGNKMFLCNKTDKGEHLCHIRGKMARIEVGDVVLLNERDYESRQGGATAVYDIMAVFASKDISKLIRTRVIPSWMSRGAAEDEEGDGLHDLFDYEEPEKKEDEDETHNKRDKKNHRLQGKNAVDEASDSDVDIDRI
jgi:translation initiation factor IF-1